MKFPFDIVLIDGLPYVSAWQMSKYAKAHSRSEWIRRLGSLVIEVDGAPFILLSAAIEKIVGSAKNKFELRDEMLAILYQAMFDHLKATGQVSPLSASEWVAENQVEAGLITGPAAKKLAEIQKAYQEAADDPDLDI